MKKLLNVALKLRSCKWRCEVLKNLQVRCDFATKVQWQESILQRWLPKRSPEQECLGAVHVGETDAETRRKHKTKRHLELHLQIHLLSKKHFLWKLFSKDVALWMKNVHFAALQALADHRLGVASSFAWSGLEREVNLWSLVNCPCPVAPKRLFWEKRSPALSYSLDMVEGLIKDMVVISRFVFISVLVGHSCSTDLLGCFQMNILHES